MRVRAVARAGRRPGVWLALASSCAAVLAGAANGLTPSDPSGSDAVYAAMGLPAAWDVTTGRPDVLVAVVDTSVDAGHPDLEGAVEPGRDFVGGESAAMDPTGAGHGTAVAGVVAARAGNGLGGVGVCFACHVLPLRVVGPEGVALNADTAAAIDYAVDHGAAVVNVSLYSNRSPQRLRDAVVRARASGVLVVAAAGNEGNDTPRYPAAFPEAISVGSAAEDQLASFSGRGDWVKFAAPGCAPVTTFGGGTDVACATSVSTPLVAGVVALLRSRATFATAGEIEAALAATARPVPGIRFGLVDAAAALAWLGTPPPRLTPVVLGRAVVGEELEALSGVWSRSGLAVTYRWERCAGASCAAIPGAVAARYRATETDAGQRLRVVASAAGAADAASPSTAVVAAKPRVLERPSIAGTPRVGARLAARRGTWVGTGLDFSFTWLRCRQGLCTEAARGSRYRVRAGDRGFRLRIEMLASNVLGSAAVRSEPTPVVP